MSRHRSDFGCYATYWTGPNGFEAAQETTISAWNLVIIRSSSLQLQDVTQPFISLLRMHVVASPGHVFPHFRHQFRSTLSGEGPLRRPT